MMIDNHHIRFFGFLPRFLNKAFFKKFAVASQAIVGRAADALTHGIVFGKLQGNQIAVQTAVDKGFHAPSLRALDWGIRAAFLPFAIMIMAEIIAPPFQ